MGRAALLLLVLASCPACGGGEERPQSALLITLDTTRAEALGCYGGPAGVTPHLDALAERALVLDEARSVTPLTLPAHGSMMTGLFPPRHGVRDNGLRPLPGSAVTLAERARGAGLETAAFVAAIVLDRPFGLDQGFDVYDVPPRRAGPDEVPQRPARDVLAAARTWIEGRDAGRPYFLWVHFYDPHAPYEPPPEFAGRGGGAPYLGEVAAMDDAIGELLELLGSRGMLDRTLIAVVGDHGEALGAHGESGHGEYVYEGTIRVPFLLVDPAGRRAGQRSSEIASVVDVYPTLAGELGLAPAAELASLDGLNLLAGPVPAGRGVYFESYYGFLNYGWSPLAGWADARGKYVHSPAPELYEPWRDREERRNLAAERADDLPRYRRAIEDLFRRPVLEPSEDDGLSSELLDELRALGYAGGAEPTEGLPHPLQPSDLPVPAERWRELEAIDRVAGLVADGELAEAVRELDALVPRYPRNTTLAGRRANYLLRLERWSEARSAFEGVVALGAARAGIWDGLGLARQELGDPAGAEQAWRRALELEPTHLGALEHLARLLQDAGRTEEAGPVRALLEKLDR